MKTEIKNHYAIYQFFINELLQESNLLVGFAEAETESEAKTIYLEKEYPENKSKQNFQRGYLSAQKCEKQNLESEKNREAIRNNKKTLGVWA